MRREGSSFFLETLQFGQTRSGGLPSPASSIQRLPRRGAEEPTLTPTRPIATPRRRHACRALAAAALLLPLAACNGAQSSFNTAGVEAEVVLRLFWAMVIGAAVIWVLVIGLSVYVTKIRPQAHSDKAGGRLIIWGGGVFPLVTLTLLVWLGVGMMPDLRAEADGPRIAVSGERFWWRVSYGTTDEPGVVRQLSDAGTPSANELFIPVGRRSEILLGSPDVIHSFWVPSVAGKTDTIPGRVNRLVLEPTREGVFNGICAEYCGDGHAQMGFRVVVVSEAEYAAHVAAQAEPARVTDHPGRALFMANGCNACHAVRGTEAAGRVGPDLTHLAARRTLAAGLLPMSPENIAAFVWNAGAVKPGSEMPPFTHLPPEDVDTIAAWLGALN